MYVAGFAPEVNEQELLNAFVTFGTSSPPIAIRLCLMLMFQATSLRFPFLQMPMMVRILYSATE